MFVDPGRRRCPRSPACSTTNEVAITISVDQVRGVAGLLVPGDFVNLLRHRAGDGDAEGDDGASRRRTPATPSSAQPARYLYQKVQILAVGQTRTLEPGETAATNADGTPTAPTNSGLITFVVPADGRPAHRLGRGRRSST